MNFPDTCRYPSCPVPRQPVDETNELENAVKQSRVHVVILGIFHWHLHPRKQVPVFAAPDSLNRLELRPVHASMLKLGVPFPYSRNLGSNPPLQIRKSFG